MPKKPLNNITGMRFGRLLVTKFVPDETKFSKFECLCDCGKTKIIMAQALIRGLTVSCGCYAKELMVKRQTKHGENMGKKGRTPTYSTWASMMMRSVWGNHPSYERYGAKGISVCDRWKSFENFKSDMGERPVGCSIDRIDNSKGYFPENCRWATRREQSLNTTRTIKVMYEDNVVCVFDLCEVLGLSKPAVRSRANRRGKDYVAALRSFGVNVSECAD